MLVTVGRVIGQSSPTLRPAWVAAIVVCLLAALVAQLAFSIRQESQTWDEGDHIFAGYMQWKRGDFGLNPEHPPLVKFLATAPLLAMRLWVPEVQNRDFKHEAFLDGREFVARNGPDNLLFTVRMPVALLTVLLALLVFFAAREMFGPVAGLLALAIVAFDPTILAHGALVTTDAGLTCFLFGSVYAFYRYVKGPSAWRLAATGLAVGLGLGAKHTGVLAFPILALLAAFEAGWSAKRAARLAMSLVVVGVIAVGVLWACYGFRYQARPDGMKLNPPIEKYVEKVKPIEGRLILTLARWRVLPESYLYGLTDVRSMSSGFPTYIFGKVHPIGVWYYFPAAFLIKSTAAFLALLLLAAAAIAAGKLRARREIVYIAAPTVFYFLVAMTAGLNIGVRHILPLYAFLPVLIAGAAMALVAWRRRWVYVFAGLLLFHAVSSARVFPAYLAYANELWGGPSQTYRYLSDSNTDWCQQLPHMKQYLDNRGVKACWFVYFGQGVAETSVYGIPCKPLPTADSMWLRQDIEAPPAIDGPVFISAGTLSGFEIGPGVLNPYDQFQRVKPTAVIDHGIFVFDGRFEIPLASALTHLLRSSQLKAGKQPDAALTEAQAAVAVCPGCIQAQTGLADMLTFIGRAAEARPAYEKALELVGGLEPDYRAEWESRIRKGLGR